MRRQRQILGALLAVLAVTTITPTYAEPPAQPKIHGKTYGEWSAQWWQWVRSIPDPDGASHPLTNSGVVDCSIGQSGPVFFLAGVKGGGNPVVRECAVPAHTELFFPLFNAVFLNDLADVPATEAEKREILEGIFGDIAPSVFNSRACNLASTVDGVSSVLSGIAIARTQSPAFRLEILADDVFGATPGTIDDEAVSDGFWVMLRLSAGTHTLRLQGDLCDRDTNLPIPGLHQDVTYTLYVQ